MRLTTSQRIIAWKLATSPRVSLDDMAQHLYGNDPDGGPGDARNSARVMLCSVVRELRAAGFTIDTRWGWGWEVPAAQRVRLIGELALEIERRDGRNRRGPCAVAETGMAER